MSADQLAAWQAKVVHLPAADQRAATTVLLNLLRIREKRRMTDPRQLPLSL
jgi:hypothetical protein